MSGRMWAAGARAAHTAFVFSSGRISCVFPSFWAKGLRVTLKSLWSPLEAMSFCWPRLAADGETITASRLFRMLSSLDLFSPQERVRLTPCISQSLKLICTKSGCIGPLLYRESKQFWDESHIGELIAMLFRGRAGSRGRDGVGAVGGADRRASPRRLTSLLACWTVCTRNSLWGVPCW